MDENNNEQLSSSCGNDDKFHFSHIFMILFLIAFGGGFGFVIIYLSVTSVPLVLIAYIPVLFVGCILPLYAAFGYIFDLIKRAIRKKGADTLARKETENQEPRQRPGLRL